MSVDRNKAIQQTRNALSEEYGDNLVTRHGEEVVVWEDRVTEYSIAWSVPFNTRSYIESGDPMAALLPCVYIVPKDESVKAHLAPSAIPVKEYLYPIETGDRGWPSSIRVGTTG